MRRHSRRVSYVACDDVQGKDFAANASHELRTPITIIKGFSETLRDMPELQGSSLAPQVLKGITEKIVFHCDRMDALISKLLFLSKVEGGIGLKKKKLSLINALENSIEKLQTRYPDAQIKTSFPKSGCTIFGDIDLLELTFFNILHNSVKYSKNTPLIKLQVEEQADQYKVSIADNGEGIARDQLERVFDRFYKLPQQKSSSEPSFGLGLALVNSILDQHSGTICATSEVGVGTTMQIDLPKKLS